DFRRRTPAVRLIRQFGSARAPAALKDGALARLGESIERFHFNRCVAAANELANALGQALQATREPDADMRFALREAAEILVRMIAPFTPHLAEECWAALGHETLVAEEAWPEADPALLASDSVTLPVQVNGKKRDEIVVPRDADAATIEKMVRELDVVLKAVGDKPIRKVIVVPQRIVNVVA
ncbi:class I tRNA ligase family protein, partial [Hansschlegelia beijingensis]